MSFEHKKSLGQHFLNSDHIPKKMCDAGNVQAGDEVFEIGPGTGILTKEILIRGANVIAIEADARAITSLEETFAREIAEGQLTIYHDDARKLDLSKYNLTKHGYKVISNIPYYLSVLLFRSMLDTDIQPSTLVFLVQKEVASRIAQEQKESLLSLSVKIFGDPTYICTVKRGHFTPPPKIDSAIIAINDIGFKGEDIITPEQFFSIIKLGFAQKRKQLIGNLSNSFKREDLEMTFTSQALPLDIRAEDIPLPTWIDLIKKLHSI
jgi:16S rRNA (adenine1518-N6/adenine1519-N6)-dimethyltransferase